MKNIIPIESITQKILLIRGKKVMLDSDLAKLYGVETKVLLQSVKRNIERFPNDFMFQLNQREFNFLRSQIVTSNGRGGRRYKPYVFTEQGVAMLSSALKSKRAIEINILIMRAFVKLREIISSNKKMSERIDKLEKKYDEQFLIVFEVIKQLMKPIKSKDERRTGFIKNKIDL